MLNITLKPEIAFEIINTHPDVILNHSLILSATDLDEARERAVDLLAMSGLSCEDYEAVLEDIPVLSSPARCLKQECCGNN